MKIIWTAKAERQLDQIFAYIASDSELYAYRLVNQIINRAESLSEFPAKGQQVPEYQRKDIRQVIVKPYRVVYLLQDQAVEILSIIHGRQLMPEQP
jgi:addiction module RelE/StbE family toxin